MATKVSPVEVYAGDTVFWPTYTFQSAPDTPIDLVAAGWVSWDAQWRTDLNATDSIMLIVDVSQANIGVIKISASPEETRQMVKAGVWDLQSANANGEVKTWVYGKTTYIQDVTRVG